MKKNTYRLIISDNKVMATTIAKAFGYPEDEAGAYVYQGADTEVLWTGGDLIQLKVKEDVAVRLDEITDLTAEEITDRFFRTMVRRNYGKIAYIDGRRITFIENAQHYCSEIVFMCQPTVEGCAIAHAIKSFFKFKIPTRIIILDNMSADNIIGAVEHGVESELLSAIRSKEDVTHILLSQMEHPKKVEINHEEVSVNALSLLKEIQHLVDIRKNNPYSANRLRKYTIGGMMGINELFVAMSTKYAMLMCELWESLIYLYANNLISNPMTHLMGMPDHEVLYGEGTPLDIEQDFTLGFEMKSVGAIYPNKEIDMNLYNQGKVEDVDTDDFMERTATVYHFIVEQMLHKQSDGKYECKEYPSFKESNYLTLAEINIGCISMGTTYQSNSIVDSLGELLCELSCSQLIYWDKDIIKVTDYSLKAIK